MRFLAGTLSVVLAWVAYEVWRNPHGHRGGAKPEYEQMLARPYRVYAMDRAARGLPARRPWPENGVVGW